ncbi:hypothetical protein [Nonomuraea basaltis]|uniref:hypothetical protein n=1 Tax=Nonomuraea basaltis TaxID=2495887 RepID=UPI00110C670E|nr:hypothetical protein [Nonomuraea basaltis]TMR89989.1 hypothetical protein EJK15_57720 [Nonomuraea basaltis]
MPADDVSFFTCRVMSASPGSPDRPHSQNAVKYEAQDQRNVARCLVGPDNEPVFTVRACKSQELEDGTYNDDLPANEYSDHPEDGHLAIMDP